MNKTTEGTFWQRFDSNRRVGMFVLRRTAKNNKLHFAVLCLAFIAAPLFWAFFSMRDYDKPIAPKEKYP